MEGPAFSTRAESHFYRNAVGAAVIGMTALPEAKLAREAEMCYALLATGTDYDCWHEEEEDVSIEQVLAVLRANSALAVQIVAEVATRLPSESACPCLRAAESAIITDPAAIPSRGEGAAPGALRKVGYDRLRSLGMRYFDNDRSERRKDEWHGHGKSEDEKNLRRRSRLARWQLGALEGRVLRVFCRWQRTAAARKSTSARLGSRDLEQPNRLASEDH